MITSPTVGTSSDPGNDYMPDAYHWLFNANTERLPEHMIVAGGFWLSVCWDHADLMWDDILLRRVLRSQNFNLIHCFFEPSHLYVETDSEPHKAFALVCARAMVMKAEFTPHWTGMQSYALAKAPA